VAVVVEVADQRHGEALVGEALADLGHGGRGFLRVHRDANEFAAGLEELGDLRCGARCVGGVGVGHRLYDDGSLASDGDGADADRDGLATRGDEHGGAQDSGSGGVLSLVPQKRN
jgi:hypothetical protein